MLQSLILIEHDGRSPKRSSLGAISLGQKLGGAYGLLVLGHNVSGVVESLKTFGAAAVFGADHPSLAEPLADRYAAAVAQAVRQTGASYLLGTSSTLSKDILPRAAALLDAAMLTDVMTVEIRDGEFYFQRPVCAGSLMATVKIDGPIRVVTALGTAFAAPEPNCQVALVEALSVDPSTLPDGMQFISRDQVTSTRPDLTEARVVVSGGRPLKDSATFEKLIGGLADALGGAVGATRAAVDAGMAPNDCQIGQTGKVVAPELYIGAGISGSIQHLAGIKDSKIIVAINRDPDAPIFQSATYGLIGDLHEVLPRLIDSVRRS